MFVFLVRLKFPMVGQSALQPKQITCSIMPAALCDGLTKKNQVSNPVLHSSSVHEFLLDHDITILKKHACCLGPQLENRR